MDATALLRLIVRAVPLVFCSYLYALYGVWLLLRGAGELIVRLTRLRHIARAALRCQQGHDVPVSGRFACASCRSEYFGWIGRCVHCGDGADMTRCPTCGVGVPLPWVTWP